LFVARLHVPNRAVVQAPAEFQRVYARNAEHGIHAIGFQQLDAGFTHVQFGLGIHGHA